jgi:hypothetical protein
MSIPENQLDTWSHRGSITQSSATYATVKSSLEAADAKYAAKDFEIFLQGSYGNDTNIYAESDVDVVIRLDSIYHYDVSALTAQELAAFNANSIPGTYPYADYKAHVIAALEKSFGSADVQAGKKAVKIKPKGSRRSADVVIATEFHKYYSGAWPLQYERGICFFTPSGGPDRQLSQTAFGQLHDKASGHERMVQANGAHLEKHAEQACRRWRNSRRKRSLIFSRRVAL